MLSSTLNAVRSVMRKSQVRIEEWNCAHLEVFSLYCTTVILMNTNVENLSHFRAVVWDSMKEMPNFNCESHASICNIW